MGQKCCVPKVDLSYVPDFRSIRKNRKKQADKAPRSAGATKQAPFVVDWSIAKDELWKFEEQQFSSYTFVSQPEMEDVQGTLEDGLKRLKEAPQEYEGLKYQTNVKDWGPEHQKYSLVKRTGSGFSVRPAPRGQGNFTYIQAKYQVLPHHSEIQHDPDPHTDGMSYQGRQLAKARHPGRGHGTLDVPHIKIIGEIHPNDISQGSVGDCWLLSAISALSEFDGAIKALFKPTPSLEQMPTGEFNKYTVTLYDMKTWEPVPVTIDERLCTKADDSGLLGCHPSIDAELWACYLEKAVAIHCGGWDEIDGGHCTHAWRILTGCKYQYTFMNEGQGFECLGTLNPNDNTWEPLENSPHKGFQGLWPMKWPEVGGGGEIGAMVGENEMFERMCAWDDQNYIMAAGTKAGKDTNTTDGIVDGHAYTVLECRNDVAGTDFDLIKVRNPWGKGEFTSGMWCDNGSGWDRYPQVKAECKPVQANDGVFWVDKDEFFKYFKTIYLCAKDMSEFISSNRPEQ